MIVAVASGKGGTGKTTVSASLTSVWTGPVLAMDLDVEEPNLHLFLRPEISGKEAAYMEVPVADETKCTFCGKCSELCQFKAISVLGETLLVFPDMCHGCGGCMAVCPEGALTAGTRLLGEVSWGTVNERDFLMGRLRVGEAMSPPLMRVVKKRLKEKHPSGNMDVVIDAPPGVSCPAVNAVMDSDVIVLVTEPTPFGLYDLKLAHQAFSALQKPMVVVVNRSGLGYQAVHEYCSDTGLSIVCEIPFDPNIARAYARGEIISEMNEDYRALFLKLADTLRIIHEGTEGVTVKGGGDD